MKRGTARLKSGAASLSTAVRRDVLEATLFGFGGGFADASSMVRFHTFTGHVTGNLVLLALSVAAAQWVEVLRRAAAIVCFAGGTVAGLRLADTSRCWWWILALQVLLIPSTCVLQPGAAWRDVLGIIALSCSLGLQNGAFTSAAGVSMHSTFVSGDLTAMIKAWMRGDVVTSAQTGEAHGRRLQVLCFLLISFAAGALAAALLSHALGSWLPCFVLIPLTLGAALRLMPHAQAGLP